MISFVPIRLPRLRSRLLTAGFLVGCFLLPRPTGALAGRVTSRNLLPEGHVASLFHSSLRFAMAGERRSKRCGQRYLHRQSPNRDGYRVTRRLPARHVARADKSAASVIGAAA